MSAAEIAIAAAIGAANRPEFFWRAAIAKAHASEAAGIVAATAHQVSARSVLPASIIFSS
jgi:hypothetical protein